MIVVERKENLPNTCCLCGFPISPSNSFSANLSLLAHHLFNQGKISPPFFHFAVIADSSGRQDYHLFPTKTCPGLGIGKIAKELEISPRQTRQLLLQIALKLPR